MDTIKPLHEIDNIDELKKVIDQIIEKVEFDNAYKATIKDQIYKILEMVCGFEIYYRGYLKKSFDDSPIKWEDIAYDLNAIAIGNIITIMVKDSDFLEVMKSCRHYDLIGKICNYIAYRCGNGFFEEDDERNVLGFPQQIGLIATGIGYDLVKLLPPKNSEMMIILKNTLWRLASGIRLLSGCPVAWDK